MPLNTIVATAYYQTYSVTELEELRASCLQVHANGGTVSRSFEGSSLTVDSGNCTEILENIMEALRMHESDSEGQDPELSRRTSTVAFDFRTARLH